MKANPTDGQSRFALASFFLVVFSLTGICVYFLHAFVRLMESSLLRAFANRPMPPVTMLFIDYRIAILLLPIPWLLFAVYLCAWRPTAARQLVFFSATLTLALVTLGILMAIAFTVPWLPPDMRTLGMKP
jgi:hypothetical protein